MKVQLSASDRSELATLFEALPLDRAMPELCPTEARRDAAYGLAVQAVKGLPSECAAGVWLYVDDLDRAHSVAQAIDGPIGALWHSIVHRREGDIWNAHYWLKQARPIPIGFDGYDPGKLIDEVALHRGESPEALVELQRAEWGHLFAACMGAEFIR